ncbi:MAG: efflux RND transporter periplasmic adaptor subunit [Cyanobacteria bacterium QS_8_64_29]|nr:MAG: efflux RND transporter periplasmic adaptor subunit [Cyanobacteria bacterium QS_8_64_29]
MASPSRHTSVTENAPASPPPRARWRRWMPIALLAGGGGFALWRILRPSGPAQQQAQAPPVTVQTLRSRTVTESSQFVARLEAQQATTLRPETSGRVTQILVSEGERVSAGTPILELSPEKSQAELNSALARVNAARAARNQARAQLQQARAERKSTAADLELAQSEFERNRFLASEGALPEQSLDRAERDHQAARANLEAARERINSAQKRLAQARAELEQAHAQAQSAREDLQDTQVTAPIDGVVGDLAVKTGDYVSTGDHLTVLTQNRRLAIELDIPAQQADRLRTGLRVELRPQGAPPSASPLATGRIRFVAAQVDPETQTILAQARFTNPGEQLRDQQRVQATVIWGRQSGLIVPTTAISRLAGKAFIYTVERQGGQTIARQTPVTLGGLQAGGYRVREGLSSGATIVTSGVTQLSDGAPITPQSP